MNKGRFTDKKAGLGTSVLIPVDFSTRDNLAVRVGFGLASRLNLKAVLIHASVIPDSSSFPQFPDSFYGMDTMDSQIKGMEMAQEEIEIDEGNIRVLKKRIEENIKLEELPEVEYEVTEVPGMPEDVIAEYCKLKNPLAVVMVTRNRLKREEELMGSVTIEVIDNCRVPVFSIPEHYHFDSFKSIERIGMFCYLEGDDQECLTALMEMFGNPFIELYLFPAMKKCTGGDVKDKMNILKESLKASFPSIKVEVADYDCSNLRASAINMFEKDHIQMIIAPHKRRNALSRFFHPGLPHRILFEKDLPLLAIPVQK